MRSLSDLRALAEEHGIDTEGMSRVGIMDALREKTGDFDPSVQLDPAKAQDLKNKLDWTKPGAERFALVDEKYSHWKLEPKLDGARIRIFFGATLNTMNTGRRSDVSYAYIERADNFPHLQSLVIDGLEGTVLDAELMPPVSSITTSSGVTTKGWLNTIMAMLNVNAPASHALQKEYGPAILRPFDVLMFGGEPVTHWPQHKRYALLEQIIEKIHAEEPTGFAPRWIDIVPQYEATAENCQKMLDAGYEGAMLKDPSAEYLTGKRMAAWQKVKTMSTGDFFIVGSVPGKGRNEGKVGSLKVAYYENGPAYCADVAGITDKQREELSAPDGSLREEYLGRVIEVMAQGRTKNNRLRHPHFVRWHEQKVYTDCTPDCSIELFGEV